MLLHTVLLCFLFFGVNADELHSDAADKATEELHSDVPDKSGDDISYTVIEDEIQPAMGMMGFSTSADVDYNIDLVGKYSWELIFSIDNSNNNGEIIKEIEVTSTITTSFREVRRTLETSTTSAALAANLGGTLYKVLNIGVQGEFRTEARTEYERISETNEGRSTTTRKKDTYKVGPHSKLTLYRLVFQGPGISFSTDTISTNANERTPGDCRFDFKVKQTPILKNIKVVISKDSVSRPSNHITEISGKNADINGGFGGSYVSLVAEWTKKKSEAATGIQVAVQSNKNSNYVDMASGAGGQYRYIMMLRDGNNNNRITDVRLFRSGSSNDSPIKKGWSAQTGDINQGRRGDYLWVGYKTAAV